MSTFRLRTISQRNIFGWNETNDKKKHTMLNEMKNNHDNNNKMKKARGGAEREIQIWNFKWGFWQKSQFNFLNVRHAFQ